MMMDDSSVRKAVQELYFWQNGSFATNFTSKLFELMAKADKKNLTKLSEAFPEEFIAWRTWNASENVKEFFQSWDIPRSKDSF